MYDQQKQDYVMLVDNSLAPAANVATSRFHPGSIPIMAQQIWATITTVTAVAIVAVSYKWRPTPGSDTGSQVLGTLNIPIGTTPGKTVYKNLTPFEMNPGGELILSLSGASATGNATIGFAGAPSWDNPSNNPAAILSA